MAPKRPIPVEEPPAGSSSGVEESSSGEEEEEEESSSEEEEHPKNPASPPPPQQTQTSEPAHKKPVSTTQEAESESESESGSESEDDSDSQTVIKPIASNPMEETPPKKPRSKPTAKAAAASSTPVKSTAAKRGSETDRDPKETKRAKKKKEGEADGGGAEKSEDTKKQLFQRLWSEDDEIAVLKGIIDFSAKKGIDPAKDATAHMGAFHEFIKKLLHFDVSLNQLKDKVWRLKRKFEKNVSKKGEEMTFSKPHDQQAFDLWKKIWGSERATGGVESSVKSNEKAKKSGANSNNNNNNNNEGGNGKKLVALNVELGMDGEKEKDGKKVNEMEVEVERNLGSKVTVEFDKSVGFAGMADYVVKRGLDILEEAKKAEMKEKWRKLHVAELELFLHRNALIGEQAELMLAKYKNEED